MVLDPLPSGRWRRRASCAASPKAIVFGTRLHNRLTPVHTSLQLERIMCARLSLSLAADPTFFVFAKPGEASPAAAPFLLEMGSPRTALPGYLTYPPYPSHSFVLIFGLYPCIYVVSCILPRQFPAPRIYLPRLTCVCNFDFHTEDVEMEDLTGVRTMASAQTAATPPGRQCEERDSNEVPVRSQIPVQDCERGSCEGFMPQRSACLWPLSRRAEETGLGSRNMAI
jgi:hypothetical protein